MAKEAKETKDEKKKKPDYTDSKYYLNRYLSLLAFNQRVLEQAKAVENPLHEKFKFLAISATNLDEYFMVKVGAIYDDLEVNRYATYASGLTPGEALVRVSQSAHRYVRSQYEIYGQLIAELKEKSQIEFCAFCQLNDEEQRFIERSFQNYIYPALTPLAVDASRPFPLVQSCSLNVGLVVTTKDGIERFATVQLPSTLPRLMRTCGDKHCKRFVFMENVIIQYLDRLFTGCNIHDVCTYRITRDADLSIDELGTNDVLHEIERQIRKRQWGETMRLEVDNPHSQVVGVLKNALSTEDMEIYEIDGPIALGFCMKVDTFDDNSNALRYPAFVPCISQALLCEDIFTLLSKKDILLHHPYEAFDPVVDFVKKAALDPQVLAIKQTLYRVSGDSPIVKALALAAENGKQVTVLLEVKARFDEENNIHWAKRLERAGCHVIYGLVGLKTHSKITLVVRLEDGVIKRYMHFGTGNYNDVTAKQYTDISLLTANDRLGADSSAVFNMLTGFSQQTPLSGLVMAPHSLRGKFTELIEREIKHAKEGCNAHIVFKVNGLTDTDIIKHLYKAATAGVRIELIVRGMCSLKPNPDGDFLHPIRVTSIVGRFLEHSRIFYFANGGNEEVYFSSADLMMRNLDHRVELLVPVYDEAIKRRLIEVLKTIRKDTVKARLLKNDGTYERIKPKDKENELDSQSYFLAQAAKSNRNVPKAADGVFIPIRSK